MDNLKEFKIALQDKNFKDKFKNIKNLNEAIKIAKENGYILAEKEVLNDNELKEDMLDAVAGGAKNEIIQKEDRSVVNSGDNNHVVIS